MTKSSTTIINVVQQALTSFTGWTVTPTNGTAPLPVNFQGTALDQFGNGFVGNLNVYLNGSVVGNPIATNPANGFFSGSVTIGTLGQTGTVTLAVGISPVTASQVITLGTVVATILISPYPTVSVVLTQGVNSFNQTFTGTALDSANNPIQGVQFWAFADKDLASAVKFTNLTGSDGKANQSLNFINVTPPVNINVDIADNVNNT